MTKPLQCCEVISLQLIKINEKKKKKQSRSNEQHTKGHRRIISDLEDRIGNYSIRKVERRMKKVKATYKLYGIIQNVPTYT